MILLMLPKYASTLSSLLGLDPIWFPYTCGDGLKQQNPQMLLALNHIPLLSISPLSCLIAHFVQGLNGQGLKNLIFIWVNVLAKQPDSASKLFRSTCIPNSREEIGIDLGSACHCGPHVESIPCPSMSLSNFAIKRIQIQCLLYVVTTNGIIWSLIHVPNYSWHAQILYGGQKSVN